ncbi:MAG: type II secretion system F family protein [Stellaceae bacterium]
MPKALDPTFILVLGLSLATAFFFVIAAAVTSGGPTSRRYKRRLRAVIARKQGIIVVGNSPVRSLSRRQSATPMMDRLFRGWLPHREVLVQRLERTGRSISIGQYMLVTLGLAVIVAILVGVFVRRVEIVGALLIGLAVGLLVPHTLLGRMGKKRVAHFLQLFPEAIDLMVRALRSGLPISEALVNCGHEIGDPVGAEFRSVEAGMRLGRDLDSMLWEVSKRIDTPEFKFFIIALAVQRETGGNLAETLANLADVLRRRRTMRKKARAMASEARTTASILGCLPILVTVVLMMTSPQYIMLLFIDPRGMILIGIAITMLVTGIGIMVKLARFDI